MLSRRETDVAMGLNALAIVSSIQDKFIRSRIRLLLVVIVFLSTSSLDDVRRQTQTPTNS
jgi:hypothetical protein